MAGPADVTGEQPSVGKDGAADAGAEREQDDIAQAARGADPGLGDECGVGVVEDRDDAAAAEEGGPVEPLESGEASAHVGDGASVARGQAGGGDTDMLGGAAAFLDVGDEGRDLLLPRSVGGIERQFRALEDHVAVGRDGHGLDARAAEVDADGVGEGGHGVGGIVKGEW